MPTTAFSSPSGMVIAGVQGDKVFIANSSIDAVQVIQLNQALNLVDMQLAPNPFFPLHIPTGPNPTQLAASHDGRYVLVLNQINQTLAMIDSTTLLLVEDSNNQPLANTALPDSATPSTIIGSPVACTSHVTNAICAGRFYVALRNIGTIAIVDLYEDASGSPYAVAGNTIAIGGAPMAMAVHPQGNVLFVTDAINPELVRIQLDSNTTPTIERFNIGTAANTVALSNDATMVAVGRPEFRDVLVLMSDNNTDIVQGALLPLNINSATLPVPQCLQLCSDVNNNACAQAHPADHSVCLYDAGLAATSNIYPAAYLGLIPTQIIAIADINHMVSAACTTNLQQYQEVLAIATLNGSIYFLGLRDNNGVLAPQIISSGFCSKPVVVSAQKVLASHLFDTCPATPDKSQGYVCTADQGGMVVMPGHVNNQTWQLALSWEAPLPGLDRSMDSAGGSIDAEGRFYDDHLQNFLNYNIATQAIGTPGDILEILIPPLLSNPDCQQALANTNNTCLREQRIVDIVAPTATSPSGALVLNVPLSSACYPTGGTIPYRIRAGSVFMVSAFANDSLVDGPTRVAPGQTYGIGASAGGNAQPVLFKLQLLSNNTTATGCDLYNTDGSATLASLTNQLQSSLLVRNQVYRFTVIDPYNPVIAGLQPENNMPAGHVPGGMVINKPIINGDGSIIPPYLLVSYTGSDQVVVLSPFDLNTPALNNLSTYVLH